MMLREHVSIKCRTEQNSFITRKMAKVTSLCYCSPAGGSTTVHKSICHIPRISRIKHTGTEECYLTLFIGIWLESL